MKSATRLGLRCGRSAALLAFVLAVGLAASSTAAASTITELAKSYTVGTGGQTAVDSFTISGAGAAEISLVDLVWPQALAGLSFELTDAAGKVLGTLTGAGNTSIDLTQAGTYFAMTYGKAAPGTSSLLPYGTYGIAVQFQPVAAVPLPPGSVLLLSGLALLTLVRRRIPGWSGARAVRGRAATGGIAINV